MLDLDRDRPWSVRGQLQRRLESPAAHTHVEQDSLLSFQIEVDPDRNVVGRLFPGADVAVDADIGELIAGLGRQQQMVDAQAVVLLPGPGLIVPEGVEPGSSVTARKASVRPSPSRD